MNIYKFHNKPEELNHYTNRLQIPEIAWNGIKNSKVRVPELEPYIAKDPYYASEYACDIIGGRFKEAEPYIAKSAKYAYMYAMNILKGRFKEAEPYIMKDPKWAFRYATNVIKRKFPTKEGEDNILKSNYGDLYKFFMSRL